MYIKSLDKTNIYSTKRKTGCFLNVSNIITEVVVITHIFRFYMEAYAICNDSNGRKAIIPDTAGMINVYFRIINIYSR